MLTVPSWSRYFFELENIGQLFVIGSVFWTSWPVYEFIGGAEKISISPWQYKLACVSNYFNIRGRVDQNDGALQNFKMELMYYFCNVR